MENRPILITCLILLLVLCLILSCASIFGAGIWVWNTATSDNSSVVEEFPLPVEPMTTPEEGITPEKDNSPPITGEDISADVAQQMDEIQMQVILDRGLEPSEAVNRGLYTPEQLNIKFIQDFEDDYSSEDARIDALSMAAFGLLDPDFDLYTFYIDLLSEQVAGFYDQETKEMVVVQGESFGGPERLTYAHEYTHALQDQNFDIENGLGYNDEACEADSERCAAIQALIEGDASLEEINWFLAHATAQDQSDIMEFYNNIEMPVFDSAPEFITMDFTFPYEYGYTFVEQLFNQGGWGTVNRAYQNLPLSTEQIIHPERYPDDVPVAVELPELIDTLGNGWEELDRGTMGEWYTFLILSKGLDINARLDDSEASVAAAGWGGDAYTVYYNADEDSTVMVMQTTWDTSADADEYAQAFRNYADARHGSADGDSWQGQDGHHLFIQQDDTTTWMLAPDADTAQAIWQIVQP